MLLLALAACKREKRTFRDAPPASTPLRTVVLSELHPGPEAAPGAGLLSAPYDENAFSVSEGKRLYVQYNCVGCHAYGGGGIGPALMDDRWIYGSAPQNIYATIVEGRPNGMPAFRGKIPSSQVWQLVSYVRSLSGLIRPDVRTGRSDHMQVREQEQGLERQRPKTSTIP
jgi:cytochrome c oxidase cbb3-type subunit 3